MEYLPGWETAVFASGVMLVIGLIFANSIVWRVFRSFRKLKESLQDHLDYEIEFSKRTKVSSLKSRYPVDRARIILGTFLFDEVQEEIDDAVSVAFEAFLIVSSSSAVMASIAWSVGMLQVDPWTLAATVFGGSELIATALLFYRLRFLNRRVSVLQKTLL